MAEKKKKKANANYVGYNSDENVLNLYLKEINRIPLLTREEEEAAAREAAKGNLAARNRLINGNLRFVVNVAKKYQGQGIPLADLISEGNIGLINAVKKFDVNRGYHFISYAVWWIRQSILRALCDKSRLIRLPLPKVSDLVRIEKAQKILVNSDNFKTEIQDIAKLLGMEESHIEEIIAISREMVSLETVVDSGKGTSQLGHLIEDRRYPAPDQVAIMKCLEDDLNNMFHAFDSREAAVIRCRFGIGVQAPMSLDELGTLFNLTKERIRQIEQKALVRLQHPSRKAVLDGYVA